MILCLRCKRLWPRGTRYCGSCRASLGARFCPHDHESPLAAKCCTACGSKRLTPGVPSLNLRPLSLLLAAGIIALAVPPLLGLIALGFRCAWCWLLNALLPPLVTLAFLSVFLGLALGEKARGVISDLWVAAFKSCLKVIGAAFGLVVRWLSKALL